MTSRHDLRIVAAGAFDKVTCDVCPIPRPRTAAVVAKGTTTGRDLEGASLRARARAQTPIKRIGRVQGLALRFEALQ